jgi:glycosyltransferase involved in cell wall biosynthesis
MKILHLATSLNGGAGRAAYRTNEALIQAGYDSSIMTLSLNQEEHTTSAIQIERNFSSKLKSVTLTKLQKSLVQNSLNLLTPLSISQINVSDEVWQNVDVVHAHASYNFFNLSDLVTLKNRGIRIITTLHDQRYFTGGCHYSYSCSGFKIACERCPQSTFLSKTTISNVLIKNLRMKDEISGFKFVSPSMWLKKLAEESALLQNVQVEVIRNAIPDVFFDNRKQQGIKSDNLNIGFCSADLNNPYKGLSLLRKAIEIIQEMMPGLVIQLTLIGKGDIRPFPENSKVIHIQTEKNVELAITLAKLDFLVVPSLADNSPSVVSESLMCGTPVLASSAGGVSEVLNRDNGRIFESNNPNSLALAIVNFDLDSNHNQISLNAQKTFGYTKVARELVKFYSD